jgi:ClpX C4-type zinc finger
MPRQKSVKELECSFCHKPQSTVGKLISSPSDWPRSYICDECIAVCYMILEDDKIPPPHETQPTAHSLISHPLAPKLLEAVESWIFADARAVAGAESRAIAEAHLVHLREMARLMMGMDPA